MKLPEGMWEGSIPALQADLGVGLDLALALTRGLERLANDVDRILKWADEARHTKTVHAGCMSCEGMGCSLCQYRGFLFSGVVDADRERMVLKLVERDLAGFEADLKGIVDPRAPDPHMVRGVQLFQEARTALGAGDFNRMAIAGYEARLHILQARENVFELEPMAREPKSKEWSAVTQAPQEMTIPVTQVKLTMLEVPGPTKAIGSVTLGGSFIVHGVRVVESPNGLFVGMPQRKDGEQYRDLAHPLTSELRARMSSAVLEEYQKLREREGPERSR